jgi:hypothetical protein
LSPQCNRSHFLNYFVIFFIILPILQLKIAFFGSLKKWQ